MWRALKKKILWSLMKWGIHNTLGVLIFLDSSSMSLPLRAISMSAVASLNESFQNLYLGYTCLE